MYGAIGKEALLTIGRDAFPPENWIVIWSGRQILSLAYRRMLVLKWVGSSMGQTIGRLFAAGLRRFAGDSRD